MHISELYIIIDNYIHVYNCIKDPFHRAITIGLTQVSLIPLIIGLLLCV